MKRCLEEHSEGRLVCHLTQKDELHLRVSSTVMSGTQLAAHISVSVLSFVRFLDTNSGAYVFNTDLSGYIAEYYGCSAELSQQNHLLWCYY